MSFGHNVALVMVNKFVKFEKNSFQFVNWYDMLKISKTYEIAINMYGPLAAMFLTK